jgi:hypothetical protein
MAFLPIIYTSLLVVFGLFALVFSVSYISYRMKAKPVHVSASVNKTIKKQIVQERINKIPIQNVERQQVPSENVIRINENKKINVINSRQEIAKNYRPKRQSRFSIINADDTRKFNQFTESVELSNANQVQTLTISDFRDIDFLQFYDE